MLEHRRHVFRVGQRTLLSSLQRAEGAEAKAAGLAGDVEAARAQLTQEQAAAEGRAAELQGRLGEKEAALAAVQAQVLPLLIRRQVPNLLGSGSRCCGVPMLQSAPTIYLGCSASSRAGRVPLVR